MWFDGSLHASDCTGLCFENCRTNVSLFFFTFLQKATRKTDKPRAEEVEVTDLTDEDLKQQLAKHGVEVGPIVGEFKCNLSRWQEHRYKQKN